MEQMINDNKMVVYSFRRRLPGIYITESYEIVIFHTADYEYQ